MPDPRRLEALRSKIEHWRSLGYQDENESFLSVSRPWKNLHQSNWVRASYYGRLYVRLSSPGLQIIDLSCHDSRQIAMSETQVRSKLRTNYRTELLDVASKYDVGRGGPHCLDRDHNLRLGSLPCLIDENMAKVTRFYS